MSKTKPYAKYIPAGKADIEQDLERPIYVGQCTVNDADGTEVIAFEAANEYAIQLTLISAPATACRVRVSAQSATGFTVAIEDSTGAGVDCSTTNAVLYYQAIKLA